MRGSVKFFDAERGFGYIEREEPGPDVFVHHESIINGEGPTLLVSGQFVEFDCASQDGKASRAYNVRVIE